MPKRKAVANGNGPSYKKKKRKSDEDSLLSLSTVSGDVNPVEIPRQVPKRIVLGRPFADISRSSEFVNLLFEQTPAGRIPAWYTYNDEIPRVPQIRRLLPHLNRIVKHVNSDKQRYPGGFDSQLRTPLHSPWGNWFIPDGEGFRPYQPSVQTEIGTEMHDADVMANLQKNLNSGLRWQGKTMSRVGGVKNYVPTKLSVNPDFEAAVHELRRFDKVFYNHVYRQILDEAGDLIDDGLVAQEINERIGSLV